jgi:hypothetical protein
MAGRSSHRGGRGAASLTLVGEYRRVACLSTREFSSPVTSTRPGEAFVTPSGPARYCPQGPHRPVNALLVYTASAMPRARRAAWSPKPRPAVSSVWSIMPSAARPGARTIRHAWKAPMVARTAPTSPLATVASCFLKRVARRKSPARSRPGRCSTEDPKIGFSRHPPFRSGS